MNRLSIMVAALLVSTAASTPVTAGQANPRPATHGPMIPGQSPVKRVVLALYDGRAGLPRDTISHRFAELPLNHLGLVLRYQDVSQPLPALDQMDDVRGILCWLEDGQLPDPEAYMRWAEAAVTAGKKLVMLDGVGIPQDGQDAVSPARLNRFLETLGLQLHPSWTRTQTDTRFVVKDPSMVEYERKLAGMLQPFQQAVPVDSKAVSYLVARNGDDPATDSHLVIVTPTGGYVAADFAYSAGAKENQQQWYLNPLAFFRAAFATDDLPKPDTATLAGRRIFYSHIDGDGWNNVSELPEYQRRGDGSAKVIFEEILRKYPDLPTTVAPIAGDLDPARGGQVQARETARAILALPNVEAGTHTYTHPFVWDFYEDYSPEKEKPYLDKYNSLIGRLTKSYGGRQETAGEGGGESGEGQLPRYIFDRPFDLRDEVFGSRDYIQTLLPPGKRVNVIQWSGDANPFEAALAMAKQSGMANINGGDSRFDRDFPSLTWVAPLGLEVGTQRQIYASNSNENTYTELWSNRFYGFRYLLGTVRNTEVPIRLKPMNVYYHMYSGQKQPALTALQANLDYARSQPLVPIATSQFVRVAEGFYSTKFVPTGPRSWRILDRGELQTIRFDQATTVAVDFARSSGVVGARHTQGSLYVYLDGDAPTPEIVLTDDPTPWIEPQAPRPYLVESSWRIWHLQPGDNGLAFESEGYGSGQMTWRVAPNSRWQASIGAQSVAAAAGPEGLLTVTVPASGEAPAPVSIVLRRTAP